ncbi:IclR family transcriptional regulator [Streptomyces sp. NPDC088354]|uniref:IclR family transcriptional regulator n=1 Tax=unclassified Streptomyces TaxID=2593676 RepID=UPI0029B0D91D|nr:IclR family transcriptional regulator [Streptomyces sp. MI02-7b]MDX3071091.1 IclR family transcriptional regulator [Streptomyces sp. MI02-7b]
MASLQIDDVNSVAQVLQRSSRIMDCFSVDTPCLHPSEIVRMTGMPSSTLTGILHALVAENVLQHEGVFYSVGLRVLRWSASADVASDLLTAARPAVAALRDRTGECCGLHVRHHRDHVTVVWANSLDTLAPHGYVGQVKPLRGGAAGKVFMAFEPSALRLVLDEGPTALTSSTVVEPEALHRQLDEIRLRGWTFAREEEESGQNALAAPVYAPDGSVTAAVTLGGPTHRVTPDRVEELAGQVTQCARDISCFLATSRWA